MNGKLLIPLIGILFLSVSTMSMDRITTRPSKCGAFFDLLATIMHRLSCLSCIFFTDDHERELARAIDENDASRISFLIRRCGANYNCIFDDSLPLVRACLKAHVQSAAQLLALGADANSQLADPNLVNSRHPSALIVVCAQPGQDQEAVAHIVQLLLDHGADIHRTILMLTAQEREALSQEHQEKEYFKKQMRRESGSITQEFIIPQTALYFAKKNHYDAAIKLLEQAESEGHKKDL